jgi:guanylate kinase
MASLVAYTVINNCFYFNKSQMHTAEILSSLSDTTEPQLTPARNQLVIALIAPSGGGKSYMAKMLCEEGLTTPVATWTTRSPRPGETDTEYDHTFVDDEKFNRRKRDGEFIVHRTLYGNQYGLPHLTIPETPTRPVLVAAKDCVVKDLRQVYPNTRVFHLESTDPESVIRRSMQERGQSATDIEQRMVHYRFEIESGRALADYVIEVNGHPIGALSLLRDGILHEISKRVN